MIRRAQCTRGCIGDLVDGASGCVVVQLALSATGGARRSTAARRLCSTSRSWGRTVTVPSPTLGLTAQASASPTPTITITPTPTRGRSGSNGTEEKHIEIDEPWKDAYVHITQDIMPSEETRASCGGRRSTGAGSPLSGSNGTEEKHIEIDEPWKDAYVHITQDIMPSEETRASCGGRRSTGAGSPLSLPLRRPLLLPLPIHTAPPHLPPPPPKSPSSRPPAHTTPAPAQLPSHSRRAPAFIRAPHCAPYPGKRDDCAVPRDYYGLGVVFEGSAEWVYGLRMPCMYVHFLSGGGVGEGGRGEGGARKGNRNERKEEEEEEEEEEALDARTGGRGSALHAQWVLAERSRPNGALRMRR
ncbi:hypothetical protein CVT25_002279 [Psilocybe cyanescens]|uniref:Uncharacterized protein n=1 Tax=Psilocybe cyanescens TaxID=93625 RepID=A0A409X6I4_PSICY|nr:hypothetical protein CVT25_002279 [Psilocybe cyanescens]